MSYPKTCEGLLSMLCDDLKTDNVANRGGKPMLFKGSWVTVYPIVLGYSIS